MHSGKPVRRRWWCGTWGSGEGLRCGTSAALADMLNHLAEMPVPMQVLQNIGNGQTATSRETVVCCSLQPGKDPQWSTCTDICSHHDTSSLWVPCMEAEWTGNRAAGPLCSLSGRSVWRSPGRPALCPPERRWPERTRGTPRPRETSGGSCCCQSGRSQGTTAQHQAITVSLTRVL